MCYSLRNLIQEKSKVSKKRDAAVLRINDIQKKMSLDPSIPESLDNKKKLYKGLNAKDVNYEHSHS